MMQRTLGFFLLVGVLLVAVNTTRAAIYKWVTEDGVVSYQDSPPPAGVRAVVLPASVPPPDTDPVVRENRSTTAVNVVSIPVARSTPKVELYVTSWCGYCKKAKNFFTSRGIPFIAYDVEKDRAAAQRKNQLSARGGVPLTVINGQLINGFSEAAYVQALGLKP